MSFPTFNFGANTGPATPGKSRNPFANGEPPSASNSFTPQGPPPSTIYGGSQMSTRSPGNSNPIFNRSELLRDSIFGSSVDSPDFTSRTRKAAPAKRFTASESLFDVSHGPDFGDSTNWGASNGFEPHMSGGLGVDEDNGPMEEEYEDVQTEKTTGSGLNFLDSHISSTGPSLIPAQRKPISTNAENAKRPKLDDKWGTQSPLRNAKLSPKKNSTIPAIIRNFSSRARKAAANESLDFIIRTEDEISRMYDETKQAHYNDENLQVAIGKICADLSTAWYKTPDNKASGTVIGPGDSAANSTKAGFLGSLLLQLHHPPAAPRSPGFSNGFGFAAPRFPFGGRSASAPIPKVLLDWLNTNDSLSAEYTALKQVGPDPTASSNFWEIVIAAILRGQLSEASQLLRSADFNYARSALEDGLPQAGYRGAQLQNIQRCINKALQVLEACPSVHNDDWDVRDAEWSLYRKRVHAALTDLEEFAEGEEQPAPAPTTSNMFQAVNFGLGPNAFQGPSFTESARMAESRVPWAIYQKLRSLYRIILGDPGAIMNNSENWVEATIGLTAWWDGEDDDGPSPPTFLRRGPSLSGDPYLRRLSLAFKHATTAEGDEKGFRINSLSGVEVGLAAVFEDDVEGVLGLLQTWSLCVAAAVAEVASVGGWLKAKNNAKPSGLNDNDLMVLSYGQDDGPAGVNLDDVLIAYATALFERPSTRNEPEGREGWELALEVLSRLDDNQKMQKSVSELLDKLPLDTAEQMDKVVLLCSELGLIKEGRRVSERYGDLTVENSEQYGLALVCYARAHNRRKVKSVVDLLISYSLVQSRAYPASNDLDEQLRTLIREPKTCLSAIASADEEAASILQFYFSGYATLRRFYETRDEAVALSAGQKPRYKPLARRRAAAQALVAAITSAADSIYGGLYDPDRDSAIQVDGLLALLGEALPLIHQSSSILNPSQQFAILSAIEDLETVTPRVYAQCEECFRSTLLEYYSKHTGKATDSSVLPPSPRALLKKSVSSLTGSSTFSIIGSDMLGARTRSSSGSADGSGVLVPRASEKTQAEREWDWRAGLPEDTKGEDILRMLRLGLANGLSLGALGAVY
ncbi:putative nuclear pore complex subunit Nup85 [Aspergillus mulundensis]|uniref:Nuclear pore complex protein Nup85 n=1 Tax=Aspergillus mulundensis TaxID=1810919 RepID=A0A3D8QHB3_9EURO|nr:Nuclear pore complex protein An-Nup85 [Aspergillus mulundensis]RDW61233.1 Nuclear pore complex protein An-Nup85 [Aspergillus mulundensis]